MFRAVSLHISTFFKFLFVSLTRVTVIERPMIKVKENCLEEHDESFLNMSVKYSRRDIPTMRNDAFDYR